MPRFALARLTAPFLLLAGLLLLPQPRAAAQPASSFDVVRDRIEIGGPFLVFIDYEDQMARLGRDLTEAVANAIGDDPELAPLRQDFGEILDELGLTGIKAIGMSSTRAPGGGYFNRSFLHAPAPRRGLLAVLGGPARPFATTRLAPADTDLFAETEIDIAALVRALTTVARRFVPDAGIDMAADLMASETGAEAAEALKLAAGLSGRTTLILRLGETAMPHVQNLEEWGFGFLQKASFLLRVEGIGRRVAPLLRDMPLVSATTVAGRPGFRAAEIVPLLGENQPVLVIDDDAVLLGSSAAFVAQSLQREAGLSASPAYAKAIAELGIDSGNTLTYASPRLFRVLRGLLAAAVQAAGEQSHDRELMPLLEAVIRQIPDPADPVISVSANLPDGILTRSRDPMSLRGTLLALGLYNPEVIAPIALAVVPAAIKAAADRRSEARAAEIAEANLQLIGEAALAWFQANPGASRVGYADLAPVLAGKLGRVRDIDFTDFELERGFGKIELELPGGETVAWYAPIGEAERERIRANLRDLDRAAAWYFRANPRETVMLGSEATGSGSPLAALPDPLRGERYDEVMVHRTDTEIAIEVGNETIAIQRDPALMRQQQPSPRRPQPRGG